MDLFKSLNGISRKSLLEGIVSTGGRLISIMLVIASTKFLTNFLSEVSYGKLALYNITATLPSTLFFGPLGQGILRYFYIARDNNDLDQFNKEYYDIYSLGVTITIFLGFFSIIVCCILGNIEWAIASFLITTLNIFNAINTYRYGLQNAARKRINALLLETGDRFLQQVLAIFCLLFFSTNPLMVLLGYNFSGLLFLYLNKIFYRKTFPEISSYSFNIKNVLNFRENVFADKKYSGNIWGYSWPFFLFGIFAWIQSASDRWVLELIENTELVAKYAVVNQIGFQSLTLFFSAISYFLFPILFSRAGTGDSLQKLGSANRLNNLYLFSNILIVSFFVILFSIWGKEIVLLLSSESYVNIAYLLPWLAVAGGLFNFGQNYSNRFMLSMQTRLLLLPKIVTAVFGCVINIFAVKYYGIIGLVASVVFVQFIYVMLLMILWRFAEKRLNSVNV